MALIHCTSCGEMISDLATVCPKCGAPQKPADKNTADTSKVDMFLAIHGKDFPEIELPMLREKLLRLSDDQMNNINMLQFKNTTVLLIISIFLGHYGIDRFMLNDNGLGGVKLLTCGGLGIWTIIDWFTVTNRTRQWNMNKIWLFLQ